MCPPQTTERRTPENSQTVETGSVDQSNTSQANQPASVDSSQPPPPSTNTNFDQELQEAQANLMKSIPDLNVSDTREDSSDSASGQMTSTASKSEQDTALDLTLQG